MELAPVPLYLRRRHTSDPAPLADDSPARTAAGTLRPCHPLCLYPVPCAGNDCRGRTLCTFWHGGAGIICPVLPAGCPVRTAGHIGRGKPAPAGSTDALWPYFWETDLSMTAACILLPYLLTCALTLPAVRKLRGRDCTILCAGASALVSVFFLTAYATGFLTVRRIFLHLFPQHFSSSELQQYWNSENISDNRRN